MTCQLFPIADLPHQWLFVQVVFNVPLVSELASSTGLCHKLATLVSTPSILQVNGTAICMLLQRLARCSEAPQMQAAAQAASLQVLHVLARHLTSTTLAECAIQSLQALLFWYKVGDFYSCCCSVYSCVFEIGQLASQFQWVQVNMVIFFLQGASETVLRARFHKHVPGVSLTYIS